MLIRTRQSDDPRTETRPHTLDLSWQGYADIFQGCLLATHEDKGQTMSDKKSLFCYKKKPIEIEAFKFYGPFLADDVPKWFTQAVHEQRIILRGDRKTDHVEIPTLEGTMIARKGDWIIKGIKGELYPCKSDIFEATYER